MSNDFYFFSTLILFAAAILQIILFFKVWGMTNDVRAMLKISETHTGIKFIPEINNVVNDIEKYNQLKKELDKAWKIDNFEERERKRAEISEEIEKLRN